MPAEFSLNTQFHVLKKREAWLSADPARALQTADADVSFAPGEPTVDSPVRPPRDPRPQYTAVSRQPTVLSVRRAIPGPNTQR